MASVGEVLDFFLKQVEHVSENDFLPDDDRGNPDDLWQKAFLFRGLFGAHLIQPTSFPDRTACCCVPRSEPSDEHARNRPARRMRAQREHAGEQ